MPNPVGRPRKTPPLEPGKPLSRTPVDRDPDDEDIEDDEFEDTPPPAPTSVPPSGGPRPSVPPESPPQPGSSAMSDEEAAAYSRAKTKDEQHVASVAAAIAAEGNPELQKRQQEAERRYRKAAVKGAPIAEALFKAEGNPGQAKDLERTIPAIALRGYYPQTGPQAKGGKVAEGQTLEVSIAEFKAAEKVGVLKRNDPLPGE